MGCDIHPQAERKRDGKWEIIDDIAPFDWRSYRLFGFLADVRNYSAVPPISKPRGLPEDEPTLDNFDGLHSCSWLSVKELLEFDYDQTIEDRRVTREISPGFTDHGCTGEIGEGRMTTYREFLGEAFFDDLRKLQELKADRIVFGFDN